MLDAGFWMDVGLYFRVFFFLQKSVKNCIQYTDTYTHTHSDGDSYTNTDTERDWQATRDGFLPVGVKTTEKLEEMQRIGGREPDENALIMLNLLLIKLRIPFWEKLTRPSGF